MDVDSHLTVTTVSQNMPPPPESEAGADMDEPPDFGRRPVASAEFQKTAIRKANCQSSLLTKALQHQSDDEEEEFEAHPAIMASLRRRSMISNASLASTADLTSDTGFTSPSRTNTPSPPLPEMQTLQLQPIPMLKQPDPVPTLKVETKIPEAAPRKRCITFACAAKPDVKPAKQELLRPAPMVKTASAQEQPRRSCIKFACQPPRPASTQNTPPRETLACPTKEKSPMAGSTSPARRLRLSRPQMPRGTTVEKKLPRMFAMDSVDLENDSAQFHEFASEKMREDDWVRHERKDTTTDKKKLTINDTLTKENHFRQIAREAEEEAEAEEEEDEADDGNGDDDEDDDEDVESDQGDEEDNEDDDETEYGSDMEDGYHTDEETGFAASDDEGDSDLELWTPSQNRLIPKNLPPPTSRRSSLGGHQSDSSAGTGHQLRAAQLGRARRAAGRSPTPELPDSTDFVCGTLDEDRPMEEAYMSCLKARKAQKHHTIPQDIDPSFPASDPEDEDAEELFNPVHHSSDDEDVWLHGEMDDLHHDQDRAGRKKTKGRHSPKRLHSPAPTKRMRSPPPRQGQTSPRRMRSPPPNRTHPGTRTSSIQGIPMVNFAAFGSRVGLTQTKSLPRPPAMFPQAKQPKRTKAAPLPQHKRGAIDIVKGLESKRLRRKEKFMQKYCNRARKGHIVERKPLRGQGAERMKELGLLMAGKTVGKGNYVLSV